MSDISLEANDRRKIAGEVLQDLFTMYTCFNIQSKIKNPFIQEFYGYIMVIFILFFFMNFIKQIL